MALGVMHSFCVHRSLGTWAASQRLPATCLADASNTMEGHRLDGRGLGTKCELHLLPQCIIRIRFLAAVLAAESIGCVQKLEDEALVFLGAISTVICNNQGSHNTESCT